MSNTTEFTIIPKAESHVYLGQRYICTFDAHQTPDKRWAYQVFFTRTYELLGHNESLSKARRAAERKIRELSGDVERGAI